MSFIHVKNLEKYYPGYKDRTNFWCKIYFSMISGDTEFELIENEIDKWRFIVLIMIELQSKKPVPNNKKFLRSKGLDFRKRRLDFTLKALEHFIEIVPNADMVNHDFLNISNESPVTEMKSLDPDLCNVDYKKIINKNNNIIVDSIQDHNDMALAAATSSFSYFQNQDHTQDEKIMILLDIFVTQYYQIFKHVYPFQPNLHIKIIRDLLKNIDKNVIIKCIDLFFNEAKNQKWTKNQITLQNFSSKIDFFLLRSGCSEKIDL